MGLFLIQLTKAHFDDVPWEQVIADCESKTFDDYHTAFQKQRESVDPEQDPISYAVYTFWLHVNSMFLNLDDEASPLHPFIVWADGSHSAMVDDFGDEELDRLAELLPEIQDAEERARVGDILWLGRRDFRAAQQSVAAYLQSAKELKRHKYYVTPLKRLERALQIGAQLGRKQEYQDAITYLNELIEQQKDTQYYVSIGHLLRLIDKYHRDYPEYYASIAEKHARIAEQDNSYHFAHTLWNQAASFYRRAEETEKSTYCLVQDAEAFVTEAEAASLESAPRYLAACVFMQDAIEAYRRIGGEESRKRIEELHPTLLEYNRQASADMKMVSVPIGNDVNVLIQQAQREARERVSGHDLHNALFALATVSQPPIFQALLEQVKGHIESFPLQFLVTKRYVDSEGKQQAVGKGVSVWDDDLDEKLKSEVIAQTASSRSVSVVAAIQPGVLQLHSEHHVRVHDLLPILQSSPFVPPGRQSLFARGLHAGLHGDYVLASHLLLPQVEASLRYILQQEGVITSGLDKDYIQQNLTLGKLLYMQELYELLGYDTVFSLQALLVEPAGANIRNLALHGIAESDQLENQDYQYFWWFMLRLCCLPIIRWHQLRAEEERETSEESDNDSST